MPNIPDDHKRREAHILKIIEQPLDVIEKEHGVWGLDHVAEIVEQRRFAAIQELQASRDRPK